MSWLSHLKGREVTHVNETTGMEGVMMRCE